MGKSQARSKKRTAAKARAEKQSEGKTRRKLSKVDLNDSDEVSGEEFTSDNPAPSDDVTAAPKLPTMVNLNQLPVRVYVCTDTAPAQYFIGVPSAKTQLGEVDSVYKVFNFIEAHHEISGPLEEYYNLTLADQRDTLLGFTDHNGRRHLVPLYWYTDPTINGDVDGIGELVTEWKYKVAGGELDHAPRCLGPICNHNGEAHGVAIMQRIRTPSNLRFVQNAWDNEQNFAGHYTGLATEKENYLRKSQALEAENAQLKEEMEQDDHDIDELRARVATLTTDKDESTLREAKNKDEIAELRTNLQTGKDKIVELMALCRELGGTLQRVDATNKQLEVENAKLLKQRDEANADKIRTRNALIDQYKKVQDENIKLNAKFLQTNAELSRLRQG